MISLVMVTVSLTVGLVLINFAHGYIDPEGYADPKMSQAIKKYNQLEQLVNDCFEHADRPNPVQDLVDKGFLSPEYQGQNCLTGKQTFDKGLSGLMK